MSIKSRILPQIFPQISAFRSPDTVRVPVMTARRRPATAQTGSSDGIPLSSSPAPRLPAEPDCYPDCG